MRSDRVLQARRMRPSSITVAGGGLASPLAKPKISSISSWKRLTSMLREGNMSEGITLHVWPHSGQMYRWHLTCWAPLTWVPWRRGKVPCFQNFLCPEHRAQSFGAQGRSAPFNEDSKICMAGKLRFSRLNRKPTLSPSAITRDGGSTPGFSPTAQCPPLRRHPV